MDTTGSLLVLSLIHICVDTGEYSIDPKIAYVKDDHIYVKPISQDTYHDISMEGEETQDKKADGQ